MMLASFWDTILAFLFAALCLVLMLVILLQRGRGVGLAGAFGGMGGSATFGAKTGDFLTWATIAIAGLMLLFAVGLNYKFVPGSAGLGPEPTAEVKPAPTPATKPATPLPARAVTPPVTTSPAKPEEALPAVPAGTQPSGVGGGG